MNIPTFNKFLDFRGNSEFRKYTPTKRIEMELNKSFSDNTEQSISENGVSSESVQFNSLRAKLYLSIKDREGKNKLMENYLSRIQGILGA